MDDFSVRKNIPISILKRRATEMRGQVDNDIIDISAPEPPRPPSPTLLNQLRKLMGNNKVDSSSAPPPPVISQQSQQRHEEPLNAPPPPSLSHNHQSGAHLDNNSSHYRPPPSLNRPQEYTPVINLESEGPRHNFGHPPPLSHPGYSMGHPHMGQPQHYPPSHMSGPSYPQSYPSGEYQMGFQPHPNPMGHPHAMGMGGPPPGYYQQGPPPGYAAQQLGPPPQQLGHPPQSGPPQQGVPQLGPLPTVQPQNDTVISQPAPVSSEKEDSLKELLSQREVYVTKAKSLSKDLDRLKQHKAELLNSSKKSAQTSAFVQENEKLQEEIKSKIKGIDNIVEMLGKIILETEGKVKNGTSSLLLDFGKRTRSHSSSSSSSSSTSSSSSSSSDGGSHKRHKKKRQKSSSSSDSSSRRRKKISRSKERDIKSTERKIHEELLRMEMERKKRQTKEEPKKRDDSRRSRERRSDFKDDKQREKDRRDSRRSREKHEDAQRSRDRIETARRDERSWKQPSPDRTSSESKREKRPETKAVEEVRVKVEKPDADTASKESDRPKVDERQLKMMSFDSRPMKDDRRSKEPYEEGVNYNFYDPEIHWCPDCNVFPTTVKAYLLHMQEESHMAKLMEKNAEDRPWHELPSEATPPVYDDPNVVSKPVPIRGVQMFVPVTGWYCKLCDTWIGDLHCASVHLKSIMHAKRYNTFTEDHPHWEIEWLSDRTRAYEKSLKNPAPASSVPAAENSKEKKRDEAEKRLTIAFDRKTENRRVKTSDPASEEGSGVAVPETQHDLVRDTKLFDEWQKTSVRETELTEVISNLKGKVMQKLRQSAEQSLKVHHGRRSPDRDSRRDRDARREDRGGDRDRERGPDRSERDRERASDRGERDREDRDRRGRDREREDKEGRPDRGEIRRNEHHRDREMGGDKTYIRRSLSRSDSSPSPPPRDENADASSKLWKPTFADRLGILDQSDNVSAQVLLAKAHAEKLLQERGTGTDKKKRKKAPQIGRMPFLNNKKTTLIEKITFLNKVAAIGLKPPQKPLAGTAAADPASSIPLPPSLKNSYGPVLPPGKSAPGPKPPGPAPSRSQLEKLKQDLNQKLAAVQKQDFKKPISTDKKSPVQVPAQLPSMIPPPPVGAPSGGFKNPPPPPGAPKGGFKTPPPPPPGRLSRFDKTTGNFPETPARAMEPATPRRQDNDDEDDLAMLGITSDDSAASFF